MMSCDGIVNVPIVVDSIRHLQPQTKRRKRTQTRAVSELVDVPLISSTELDSLFNYVPLETASSELDGDGLFDVPLATTSSGLDNLFDVPLATASSEPDKPFEVPPLATASNELDNLFEVPPLVTASSGELDKLFEVPLDTASNELDNLFDAPLATTSCGLDKLFDIPFATASCELDNLFEVLPLAIASNELDNLFEVPPLATDSSELDNLLDVPIEVNATFARNQSAQQEDGNVARQGRRTTQQRNTVQQRICHRSEAKSTTALLALIEEKKRECAGLEEKLKNLCLGKDVVDGELNSLKIECSKLKERVAQLEEVNRVLCEKEKNGQEEILSLSNVKEKCEQLEQNNESLELEKNRLKRELNDIMISLKDLTDQNSHLEHQALVCESEKVALNSRITDLCEEIRNMKGEKRGLIRADSTAMNCLDKDVSDNGEERSNTNKNEEIQSESGNRSYEVIDEPRNRNEEIEREASVGLDCEALPTVKGEKNNPIDVESDIEDGLGTVDNLQSNNVIERHQTSDRHLISCKIGSQSLSVSSQSQRIEENEGQDKRASHGESKWRSRVHLLLSLGKDSELCLKAVCALCRQHALKEKSEPDSLGYIARRGFFPFDEARGTELGEFLMDGNRAGDLKKSVEELKLFDPRALDECKKLAKDYSDQLFNIYQSKEDLFFSL